MQAIIFLAIILFSIQRIPVNSRDYLQVRHYLARIAEQETGVPNVEAMVDHSRLVSIGSVCRLANYRFYPTWNGDPDTARSDDEVIDVSCNQPINSKDWNCTVQITKRAELRSLDDLEAQCDT